MLYRMKVKITALIPDNLLKDAKKISSSKNTTETLIKALETMIATANAAKLGKLIHKSPLVFQSEDIAHRVRAKNRLPT